MAFSVCPATQFQPPLTLSISPSKFHKPLSINLYKTPFKLSCFNTNPTSTTTFTDTNDLQATFSSENDQDITKTTPPSDNSGNNSNNGFPPPLLKKKKRYRKEYPGESIGICEEMRFVAMKFRNDKGVMRFSTSNICYEENIQGASWEPTFDGFLKYLVDSKLVFHTIEAIVEDSNDVSYAYFRRTGLERSESLARDLEWFSQQNMLIPEPSNPGNSYVAYLKELSEKSAPMFLSHFYNIYFSHIAGGQVITKQVAEKLQMEKELNFYTWDKDAQELLKDVREKLNRLGEHWSRDDKNRCLKETTKSLRYMGQIVRLIIL